MSTIFGSSIGRKLLMSLSGLFLVVFLIIHLSINLLLLVPDGGQMFNVAANFMALPLIKYGLQPVLFAGFIVHIIYAAILTAQNNKARGSAKYASGNNTKDVMWASKNMFVLGLTVSAFLVVHLIDYWVPLQITHAAESITIDGVEMHNTYALVNAAFAESWRVILYVIGALGLTIHLTHGFWSAFQTLGLSNNIWRKRWTVIGIAFAWIVGLGFSLIAILQFAFYQ
ncbi:succinate dehydrogenase cytochrome b subunit [Carboxylicivirga mesophila]|uniref:Succinate dehydrogenase cytochrome b subunit n=1 Tax=Carboxylicivirga mesophila TaxID=1166478 RepID=A0ABS5K4K6_9BACT|nr:succinate dehydrogenase cytochrome b subunit [Carboxylicivirga mesophila]MBS2209953.1 succinate dehydrogenase cytochrome b subunit [Carboxylicivirga mesophila]